MRICFLTHYFPPEVGAPQTRIAAVARSLAERGCEVAIHTGFPHYPHGHVIAPYRNRPWLRERDDGILVIRSAIYPAANRGFARRLANHASLGLSALISSALSGGADVVVAETPPLFTAAAGVLYARAKRAAYVVNVADRWPESAIQLGVLRGRRAISLASALERWVYRHADLVTVPTEGLHRDLEAVPEAGGKVRQLSPLVDTDRFDPRPRSRTPDSPLRVLYAGTVGLAQGLEVLVEASRLAGSRVVQTTVAGGGADSERLREIVHRGEVDNVDLIGIVGPGRVPGLYAEADAGAVLLHDVPLFRGALPTKMFETMAAGRPLLLAVGGEAADLVRSSGAGIVVSPDDPAALAEAIGRLQSDPERAHAMGAAGRRWVEANLGRARTASQWLEALTCANALAAARRGQERSPIRASC